MRRTVLICFLAAAALVCRAQDKHALVIGIGQYHNCSWARIHADSDIDYAVEMLQANGFEDIRCLRNDQATKQAIIDAFKQLESDSKIGDRVYIHFSGHGQQITDLNGDEDNGWDESWVPYDASPIPSTDYNGERHLIDDEVNGLLFGIKRKVGTTGRIVVVIDACHSGGAAREEEYSYRGFDDPFIIENAKPLPVQASIPEEWITLSACRDYQVNFEISNPEMGRLTWCLYSLKNKLGVLSNDDLKKVLIRMMKSKSAPFEQTPEITGCTDTESVKDLFD